MCRSSSCCCSCTSKAAQLQSTVPLARTEVCGQKNTVWSRRAAILDPKFNEEHDVRYQFWPQSARSAASARGRPASWPAAGQASRARARIQRNSAGASSQISEFRSCMHEILLHACTTRWTTTRIWTRLPNAAVPCFLSARPQAVRS